MGSSAHRGTLKEGSRGYEQEDSAVLLQVSERWGKKQYSESAQRQIRELRLHLVLLPPYGKGVPILPNDLWGE